MGPFTPISYVDPNLIQAGILAQMAEGRRPAESRLRVLVVDDNMRIADTTAEVLEQSGFEVRTAYSGESALQTAAGFAPDCLLSDVVMPGMSGVQLALAMFETHPTTRVVLMSGQVGISDVLDDAERQGLQFELLAKPIHPAKLIEYLRKTPKG